MSQHDLLYRIGITKIPKVGAVTARNLISYCGSARGVFEARKKELLKVPGIGEAIAASILQQDVLREAEAEMEFNEQNGIRAIFYTDEEYPHRLRPYDDAPVVLYYKGNANLNYFRIIGMVGTRTPTPSGIAICEELIDGLQAFSPLIISGLAYGIDITAHRKSLITGLDTIGVLGHGLRQLYPQSHRTTAAKMISQGGLLTEFHSHVSPDRENFPMRNRIIAGMCDALIVVETANKGGSIITAEIANQYNKDVFAVPGRLNDKFSQGCNHLIKVHKAALIEKAADIAYIMRWEETDREKSVQTKLFVELSESERQITDLLQHKEGIGIDQLCYLSKKPASQLVTVLLELEFKGVVRALPGKRYVLV